MNYYPDALKAILAYIEALNAVDKALESANDIPYLAAIPLTDSEQTNYGKLVDEVGGSWSWEVPTS